MGQGAKQHRDISLGGWVIDVILGWLGGSVVVGIGAYFVAAMLFGYAYADSVAPGWYSVIGAAAGIAFMRGWRQRRTTQLLRSTGRGADAQQPWFEGGAWWMKDVHGVLYWRWKEDEAWKKFEPPADQARRTGDEGQSPPEAPSAS